MAKKGKKGLTPKQQAFVNAYIETGNASEAYRRAYPACDKWKEKSIRDNAHILLRYNTGVIQAVTQAQAGVAQRNEITIDWVLQNLKEVAEACKKAKKLDSSGANKALELIGKHLGFFEADNRQKAFESVVLAKILVGLPTELAKLITDAVNKGNGDGQGPGMIEEKPKKALPAEVKLLEEGSE